MNLLGHLRRKDSGVKVNCAICRHEVDEIVITRDPILLRPVQITVVCHREAEIFFKEALEHPVSELTAFGGPDGC